MSNRYDYLLGVTMIEFIGWIGSMLFALCALPQVILVWKQKHAHGLSWGFLNMWFWGEVLCFLYVASQPVLQIPLLANYILNFVLLLIIFFFKVKGNYLK